VLWKYNFAESIRVNLVCQFRLELQSGLSRMVHAQVANFHFLEESDGVLPASAGVKINIIFLGFYKKSKPHLVK